LFWGIDIGEGLKVAIKQKNRLFGAVSLFGLVCLV